MMEEALIQRLNGKPTLAPLVPGGFHWQRRPDGGNLTTATLSTAGEDRLYNHEGPDGLQEMRIQIDVRAVSALEAKAASRAILNELEKAETVGGVNFAEAIQVSAVDAPLENLGDGTEVFRVTRDVNIMWSQA